VNNHSARRGRARRWSWRMARARN